MIGTFAVISLVALGEGVSYKAQQQIKELGATNIICRNVQPNTSDASDNDRVKRYGLLRSDYERLLSIPTITRAVPMRELRREIRANGKSADAKLVGCTKDYLELNSLRMARGRWLTDRDEGENVIVLASGTVKELFPFEDPIGKQILVGKDHLDLYVVVGQTASRDPSAAIGGSLEAREYNMDAYIPLGTLRERVGDFVMERKPGSFTGEIVELTQITLSVDDMADVDVTARVIDTALDKYHEKEDYSVVVPKELLRQAQQTRAIFNTLLVVIAGISLLVGGIGIMNIMLATVTERTREIGIRRALGAKRADIIQQFLIETIVLTSVGGLLGVGLGVCTSWIWQGIRWTVNTMSPDILPPIVQSIEPRVALWSVGLALFVSVGVGILFGVYPARQAAHMDPIEALRHE